MGIFAKKGFIIHFLDVFLEWRFRTLSECLWRKLGFGRGPGLLCNFLLHLHTKRDKIAGLFKKPSVRDLPLVKQN